MSAKHIYGLLNLLESTRTGNAADAINEEKQIAEWYGLDTQFQDIRKINRMFDEKCEDKSVQLAREYTFRISLLEIIYKTLLKKRIQF